MRKIAIVLVTCLVSVCAVAAEGPDALLARLVPGADRVYDHAGVFTSAQKAELEAFLRSAEQKTTSEIAVVTLNSLEGGEINDFANRLFEKWGIGKKGKDNGVLLLAAIQDRKVRIEVGYGLEGALPDAKTGRILDDYVIPEFKQQKYGDGLIAGAVALAGVVAREAGVEVELSPDMQGQAGLAAAVQGQAAPHAEGQAVEGNPLAGLLVFGFMLAVIIFIGVATKKGWIKPGTSTGGSGRYGGGGSRGGFSGGGGFGGGRSGGGGASRGW